MHLENSLHILTQDKRNRWVGGVEGRRGKNITAVTNKNVRIAWVLLAKKEDYQAMMA